MEGNQIIFRVSEQQYNELAKKAEAERISPNIFARELVLEAMSRKEKNDTGAETENLLTDALREEINRELIQMAHIIEKLPKSWQKDLLKERLENIWLMLN